MKVNILVTGCGGDIGQSVGKILNKNLLVNNLFGCDISDKNAAKFIYPNFFVSIPCTDKNYLSSLEKIVKDYEINIVLPISEPELRFFSESSLTHIGKAILLMASKKVMKIGFDKLKTSDFLKHHGFPFPVTELVSPSLKLSFPFIMKSRKGSGSKTVFKVQDYNDYKYLSEKHPNFIAQEYLDETNGEYTCGVFRSKTNVIRTITFKRELTGGYSGYGEIIKNESIESLLISLASEIDLIGSINVQLRITEKGPVIFEINPRFSSTVLFRHMFGFCDLEWSLEDFLNIPISPYKDVKEGKFYKGFNEYVIYNNFKVENFDR